jgi:hypothetical protein
LTDFVVVCVDRPGDDPEHDHVYQALVRPVGGGDGKLLPVKDIRRQIKLGANRFFSLNGEGERVRVKRYKCGCGCKTIRTGPDDIRDGNLSIKGPCT